MSRLQSPVSFYCSQPNLKRAHSSMAYCNASNVLHRSFCAEKRKGSGGDCSSFLQDCIDTTGSRFILLSSSKGRVLCIQTSDTQSTGLPAVQLAHLQKDELLAALATTTTTTADEVESKIDITSSSLATTFNCVVLGSLVDTDTWVISVDIDTPTRLLSIVSALSSTNKYALISGRDFLKGESSQPDSGIAGYALSLHLWHKNNAFLPSTGEATISIEGGLKRAGIVSGMKTYPRVDPVAIACVISADGKRCLLVHSS
jgi:hypothetical protein